MKTLSLLLFTALSLAACKNGKETPKEAISKDTASAKVENGITDKHQHLPNSDFYIIPPAGFVLDSLMMTYSKHSDTGYAAHYVPMSMSTTMTPDEFTKQMQEKSAMFPGVMKSEELNVSGVPAVLTRYQFTPGIKVWQLRFKEKWPLLLLLANYDANDEQTGEAMYQSLKTTIVKTASEQNYRDR